jgi:hypothetical protein
MNTALYYFEVDPDAVDVTIYYNTNNIMDKTVWWDDAGQGFEKEMKTWKDQQRLVLSFKIDHGEAYPPTDPDDVIRCLACLSTHENSALDDGDKGFAACYHARDGNLVDNVSGEQ